MKSLQELCLASGSGENFNPERLHRLEAALVEDHHSEMPWYLRVIVGIGAWLASLFFLGFTFVLIGWKTENQMALGAIGVILLVLAVAAGRQSWGIFTGQCALAVSLVGQVLIYIGFVNEHDHPVGTATTLSVAVAALLYVLYPNFLSRFMTCLGALQLTLIWIYAGEGQPFFENMRMTSDLSPWSFSTGSFISRP